MQGKTDFWNTLSPAILHKTAAILNFAPTGRPGYLVFLAAIPMYSGVVKRRFSRWRPHDVEVLKIC